MTTNTTQTRENQNKAMDSKNLVTISPEELKKEELIGVLAGLIKNYASKKQQNK